MTMTTAILIVLVVGFFIADYHITRHNKRNRHDND